MSRYLSRQSLIGCTLAIGLLSGVPLVQAGEGNAEHGSMDHGTMDHNKMNHESMDHDSNTKKAD